MLFIAANVVRMALVVGVKRAALITPENIVGETPKRLRIKKEVIGNILENKRLKLTGIDALVVVRVHLCSWQ